MAKRSDAAGEEHQRILMLVNCSSRNSIAPEELSNLEAVHNISKNLSTFWTLSYGLAEIGSGRVSAGKSRNLLCRSYNPLGELH